MAIPVETPNEPAAAAMRDFLGIIPTEDLSAVASPDGTEKVAVLAGAVPGFMTTQEIADLGGGGGASAPLTLDGGTVTANTPPLTITQTWDGSANFVGLYQDFTAVGGFNGKFVSFSMAGSEKFSVNQFGGVSADTYYAGNGGKFDYAGLFSARSDGRFQWSSSTNASGVIDTALARNAAGVVEVNNGTPGTLGDLKARDILLAPSASLTPANNGDLVIEKTSNTTLTFKLKGSDGVVRSVALTLA